MERKIYSKPPIQEALIEFHLAEEITGEDLFKGIKPRLSGLLDGQDLKKQGFRIKTSFKQNLLQTSAEQTPPVHFLQSKDGRRFIGCGDNLLCANVREPYPGWENFIEHCEYAVGALPERQLKGGATKISIRYIDQIEFSSDKKFEDYFTITPFIVTKETPGQVDYFQNTTHTFDQTTNIGSKLITATRKTKDSRHTGILFDLTVFSSGNPIIEFENGKWTEAVEKIHKIQRNIFESSITDHLREQFK